MIYQHRPQRFHYELIGRRVVPIGPIKAGAWIRLISREWHTGPREVVQVEGWIPRDYAKWQDGYGTPSMGTVRVAGGHLAQVRNVKTGERFRIAEQYLYAGEQI